MKHLEMPTRPLGTTGERVSIIGLGGSHIGSPEVPGREAIRIIRSALDRGLSFMDNSWDYNGGESEVRLGKALKDGYRKNAFVMTKVDGRTKKEATRQLHQSLKRLGVDSIDLLQHHEIIRFDDVDRIFADGGAMEAFEEARKAGKIRYIGFTGHKDPHVHLYMLNLAKERGVRFDTVQMPLNVLDAHFRSFQQQVLPLLVRDKIGVLGMKSMGSGVLLKTHMSIVPTIGHEIYPSIEFFKVRVGSKLKRACVEVDDTVTEFQLQARRAVGLWIVNAITAEHEEVRLDYDGGSRPPSR